MTELQCQRCSYEWDYQGESEYYATCPNCKTTVTISGNTLRTGLGDEIAGFSHSCDIGTAYLGENSDVETTAIAKIERYDDSKWLSLIIEADCGAVSPTLETIFHEKDEAIEFAEQLKEAAEQISD